MPEIGGKTIHLTVPKFSIIALEKPSVLGKALGIPFNEAPRAGQSWRVDSVYYSLNLLKANHGAVGTAEMILEIFAYIGNQSFASQVFLEGQIKPGQEVEEPRIGTLEAYAPPTLYPGQEGQVNLGIQTNTTTSTIVIQGFVLITYTLILPETKPRAVVL
jgi:hypothetical protein